MQMCIQVCFGGPESIFRQRRVSDFTMSLILTPNFESRLAYQVPKWKQKWEEEDTLIWSRILTRFPEGNKLETIRKLPEGTNVPLSSGKEDPVPSSFSRWGRSLAQIRTQSLDNRLSQSPKLERIGWPCLLVLCLNIGSNRKTTNMESKFSCRMWNQMLSLPPQSAKIMLPWGEPSAFLSRPCGLWWTRKGRFFSQPWL